MESSFLIDTLATSLYFVGVMCLGAQRTWVKIGASFSCFAAAYCLMPIWWQEDFWEMVGFVSGLLVLGWVFVRWSNSSAARRP